jgi:hypothetical protein
MYFGRRRALALPAFGTEMVNFTVPRACPDVALPPVGPAGTEPA